MKEIHNKTACLGPVKNAEIYFNFSPFLTRILISDGSCLSERDEAVSFTLSLTVLFIGFTFERLIHDLVTIFNGI